MLPRSVELMRVIYLRQYLTSRNFYIQSTRYSVNSCRLCWNLLKQNDHQNNYRKLIHRRYTTKDQKIVAASIAATSNPPKPPHPNKQSKKEANFELNTIPKSSEEPLAATTIANSTSSVNLDLANNATISTSNLVTDVKATSTSSSIPHVAPPPTLNTQTKSIEIKTSKGLLSVTTTIEDSKINEVVLEKSKMVQSSLGDKSSVEADKSKKPTKAKKIVLELPAQENEKESSQAGSTTSVGIAIPTSTATSANVVTPAVKPPKPKRTLVDFDRSSLERNFITPMRAMSDFLLKASDLESLAKIKRRSPYEQEPPITVYWRRDVEAKAIDVWGSRENLLRERLGREIEHKKHLQNIFTMKRRLRDYRREIGASTTPPPDESGLRGNSGKVVLIAIAINGVNCLFKACGWLFTGSHSMFAETIHSMADTINQCILAYGIHKSVQIADTKHPYGYSNMRYVSSLISGVGIFCLGTGLSYYHGITGILHPEPMQDFFWAFFILGGSLVSEGATLLVAINEVRRAAKLQGIPFKEYVLLSKDPCVNVVLMEDSAAVTSVGIAGICMGLTSITGSPIFDAVGSILVGTILGGVASFIVYTNVAALVGKSIPEDQLDKINYVVESDVMIRAIHDVKAIDMGNSLVRYKAEIDFDGRELTRSYFDKQDLNELLKTVKSFQTVEDLEQFLLSHGENIVDLMGGEIDRIELKLRKKFPQIRHCDLEIL